MHIRKFYKIAVGFGAAVTLAVMYFAFGDWPRRYENFNALTVDRVVEDAKRYAQQHSDAGMACIYAVECTSGRARLRLIEDVGTWDIHETKELVWRRRFEDFCQGRTTNIGLEILMSADGEWRSSTGLARWSFYYDRFLPQLSRFQSGSFSAEADWERCSAEHAIDFGVAE